jgi:hypothetical protein
MTAGWRVAGVSVTGPGHVRRGVGNQDAFEHRTIEDGFVLAVADGAPSALDAWRRPATQPGRRTATLGATRRRSSAGASRPRRRCSPSWPGRPGSST